MDAASAELGTTVEKVSNRWLKPTQTMVYILVILFQIFSFYLTSKFVTKEELQLILHENGESQTHQFMTLDHKIDQVGERLENLTRVMLEKK